MITLFVIALAATALFFAAVPVVLFALMVETCAQRAANTFSQPTEQTPRTLPFAMRAAA